MCPQDEKFHATWDLGEEWFRWTGLPFVFAMWVARNGQGFSGEGLESANGRSSRIVAGPQPLCPTLHPDLESRLSRARDLGVRSIPLIAAREALLMNLPEATTIQYLTRNLHFHLGPAERNGLQLFHDLAARCGLLQQGNRPLTVDDEQSEQRRVAGPVSIPDCGSSISTPA